MNLRKVLTVGALTASLLAGTAACESTGSDTPPPSGQQSENNAQDQDTNNLNLNQPIPVFKYSQARQTLINAETIEAEGQNTTTFGVSNNGLLVWECSSIGMPVPASAQLSNPSKIVQDPYGGGYRLANGGISVDQQDPFGIYTGQTTGTYTLCVNPQGKQYLQYWEGYTDAVSGPATWDTATHQVKLLGTPLALKPVVRK